MELDKQLQLKKQADSGDIDAIYDYGIFLYLEIHDHETALKYLLEAASKNYGMSYGDIGVILYIEKNDFVNAEKWFKKAENVDCLLPWAAYEYGMLIYHEKEDYKRALNFFYKAANEDYELSYSEIGIILHKEMNDAKTAEMWFKKAEKANYLSAPAAYEYGMLIYFEREDYDEALKYHYKAASDKYELSYGEIGSLLFSYRRDLQNAQKWFEKAEKVDCLFAPSAYDYGMLYLELGDDDKALKYLLAAANDNYELAYEEIGEIYYKRNDIENAEKWYKKADGAIF